MKVVHINWALAYGGIETMLVNIVNEQARLGTEVSVVIINDIVDSGLRNCIDPKVNLILLGRKVGSKGIAFVKKLNDILECLSPDVVHCHVSKIKCLIYKRHLGKVKVTTLHDMPSGRLRRSGFFPRILPFLNYGLPGNVSIIDTYSKVFTISQAVHDELKINYGVESTIINNGVITNRFKVRDRGESLEERLKIVMVSRLMHSKKGQDLLVRAVADLTNVEVDFIGEGESFDYLQNLINELNVAGRVRLLGKRDQSYIQQHLCDYDLFVQPSRYEGFGLTVAEAMAANVPVLVSSGQGPAEITCRDKYGWVFENGNLDDLVKKIKYIIENYSVATNKSSLAREYVIGKYDVSITAKEYLEHYLD